MTSPCLGSTVSVRIKRHAGGGQGSRSQGKTMPHQTAPKLVAVDRGKSIIRIPAPVSADIPGRRLHRQTWEVCVFCKRIKLSDARWAGRQSHMSSGIHASYRNSICPPCSMQRYPKLYERK